MLNQITYSVIFKLWSKTQTYEFVLITEFLNYIKNHSRRQGEHMERPPPEIEKNCCRKMVLFPKALFLATTFPKLAKNWIFLLNFYQNFSKLSQIFKTISIFRQNTRKSNTGLVKFFWKYAKLMHFKQFLKKFFEDFLKFLKLSVFRPNAR